MLRQEPSRMTRHRLKHGHRLHNSINSNSNHSTKYHQHQHPNPQSKMIPTPSNSPLPTPSPSTQPPPHLVKSRDPLLHQCPTLPSNNNTNHTNLPTTTNNNTTTHHKTAAPETGQDGWQDGTEEAVMARARVAKEDQ